MTYSPSNIDDRNADTRMKVIGAILVKARKHRRISLRELSECTGLHRSSLSRLENGRQHLEIITLNAIAKALGFSPQTLSDAILRALSTFEESGMERAVEDCRFPEVDPGALSEDTRRAVGMGQVPVSLRVAGNSQSNVDWETVDGEIINLSSVEAAEVKGNSMSPVVYSGQKIMFVREWPSDGDLCICSIGGRQYFKRYYERVDKSAAKGTRIIVTLVNVNQDPVERPMEELEINQIDWCYTVVGTWLKMG